MSLLEFSLQIVLLGACDKLSNGHGCRSCAAFLLKSLRVPVRSLQIKSLCARRHICLAAGVVCQGVCVCVCEGIGPGVVCSASVHTLHCWLFILSVMWKSMC